MNRLVLSIWLISALIFGAGVLFLVQSSIGAGPGDSMAGSQLREGRESQQVIAADEARNAARAAAAQPKPADPQSRPAKASSGVVSVTKSEPAASGHAGQIPALSETTASVRGVPGAPAMDGQADGAGEAGDNAQQAEGETPPGAALGSVTVTGANAMMRAAADKTAPAMFAFPVGRRMTVLAQGNGWTKVSDPQSGATGWIANDQLSIAAMGPAGDQNDYADNNGGYDNGYDIGDAVEAWVGRRRHHRDGPIAHFFRRAFGF